MLVTSYEFFTSLQYLKGGGGQGPQPCCLQIVWLLTNFHRVYTLRHGLTHSTFFVFCFVYYYGRSAKVLIPEGPSLRHSVLPICHDDLRMYKFRLHIFDISDQFNVIGCWTDLGIDHGVPT